MISNILDRISFWSLFCVIVLLPIFFLPFTKIPIETAKSFLLIVGLAMSIIFWTAARFSDGKIILPKSRLLVSGFSIVLVFLLSAIFSPAVKVSFFGTMFDFGTFYFILTCFLLMVISSIILKDSKKVKVVLSGFIISSVILIVFQIFHLFLPNLFSLGFLVSKTSNILGSWNVVGVFAGLFVITSLFIIEFFKIYKTRKIFLGIFILLSVFLITAVNFPLIWVVVGSFALLIFIFKVSFFSVSQVENKKRVFPIFPFLIVMISLLFFITGPSIGQFLPNYLKISNTEIRPSLGATMSLAKSVIVKNPILGAGPNRFNEMWDLYKPSTINSTYLWDNSFNQGSGIIPTFIVTTGILGIIAWLIFLVFLIINGVKAFSDQYKENISNNLKIIIFFIMSLYLFIISFFYSAGSTILLLAFAFLGIFVGLYSSNKEKGEITVAFLDDPRKSFFSILLLVFIILVSATAGFIYVERFISVIYFQKTLSAQNIPEAQIDINKAVSLYSNDFYLRTYAQVYVVKINSLINKGTVLSDTEKNELKTDIDQSIEAVKLAVAYDKTDYQNYKALGSIYELIAPLGLPDTYNKAIEAYKIASTLNPLNPSLKLSLAHVSFLSGKTEDAKNYANQALTLKGDYIDALIVLSQIVKSEGDNSMALSYAEAALSLLPQNVILNQYVNSLKNLNSTPAVSAPNPDKSVEKPKTKK